MTYNTQFYDQINAGSIQSAHIVVDEIMNIWEPTSVVDFGCGEGAWLSVFKSYGCTVKGLDGSYVDKNRLLIDESEFEAWDLANNIPVIVYPKMDIAISLEVAEHLPASSADDFVSSICQAADIVIFSAAIPGQKGVGHINEQWPSYWVKKFKDHGFVGSDFLRNSIWDNSFVENWYRQNILVFVNLNTYPNFGEDNIEWGDIRDVVHPTLWRDHYLSKL